MEVDSVIQRIAALAPDPAAMPYFGMVRICEITGLHERVEEEVVELWRSTASGRVFLRVYCEGGNSYADVEVADLLEALGRIALGADASGH